MGLESGSITEVTNRNHNSGKKMIKSGKRREAWFQQQKN